MNVAFFPSVMESIYHTNTKDIIFLPFSVNGTQEYEWARKIFKNLIGLNKKETKKHYSEFEIDDLIKYTNLTDVCKKYRINAIIPPLRSSKYAETWAIQNNITLISASFRTQRNFENKIWFDKFLKKYALPKPKMTSHFPSVMQTPQSEGGEGTFFINKASELKDIIEQKLIKKNAKLLMREHIKGTTYGITIFIDPSSIILSALRKQCFGSQNGFQKLFNGIQWMKTNNFNKETIKSINNVFIKLGKALHQNKFLGFANIDFIIDRKGKIFIIECNPRLSNATFQIAAYPELISGIKIFDVYVKSLTKIKKWTDPKIYEIPNTIFQGSTINIKIHNVPYRLQKTFKNGVYAYYNSSIKYKTADIYHLSNKHSEIVFYSEYKENEVVNKKTEIAELFMNFPVYNNEGTINKKAKKILNFFTFST